MQKSSERFHLNLSQQGLTLVQSELVSVDLVISKQFELNLAGNCIDQKQSALLKLRSLKSLNLSLNHIQVLYPLPTNLEILNLSCNHIKDLPLLNTLQKLRHLDLSCNLISNILPLQGLSSLRTLLLAYNLIQETNALDFFPQIVDIDLEHNKLANISSTQSLISSTVIVFIFKNNPISEWGFKKHILKVHPEFVENNEIFCKDPKLAEKFQSSLWKNSENSGRLSKKNTKVYEGIQRLINSVDVINEADEIRDELEELRVQLDLSELQYKKLKKVKMFPYMSMQVEKQLMAFHEKLKYSGNSSNDEKPNYFNRILEVKHKNKDLRKKYKAIKLEFNQTLTQLETKINENLNLKEDLGYNKLENSRLTADLESLQLKANRYKSRASSKKLLKKPKIFAIAPSFSTFDKDSSLFTSPLFNQSYQLLTSEHKKKPVLELTQNKVSRGVRLMKIVNP